MLIVGKLLLADALLSSALLIVLAALLHPSLWIVALVIALVNWVQVARIVYTETRSLAERDFILAERSLGAGHARILPGGFALPGADRA